MKLFELRRVAWGVGKSVGPPEALTNLELTKNNFRLYVLLRYAAEGRTGTT